MPIYTHISCVYIFIKIEKIQAEIETHAWNIENRPYNFFLLIALRRFLIISYDNCAIFYENCEKKTTRVGGIFRVGCVTPIQLFFCFA